MCASVLTFVMATGSTRDAWMSTPSATPDRYRSLVVHLANGLSLLVGSESEAARARGGGGGGIGKPTGCAVILARSRTLRNPPS